MDSRIAKLSAMDGVVTCCMSTGETFVSTDMIVSNVAQLAFQIDAAIKIEPFEGETFIRRIENFRVRSPQIKNVISRVATQWNAKTNVHFVEVFVFVRDGADDDKAYRVLNESVQLVCLAAARTGGKLVFAVDDDGVILAAQTER